MRVTNVIVSIWWDHTIGQLCRIVEAGFTGLTAFCGDNNDTRHSACTIYRCSRTILQDLEWLDILGVDTCDSAGNQRFSITRRQIVCAHLYCVFQYDTIHNPQRFGWTVNRRSTADADFWSCTKGTGYVLYAHTCSTTFQATADISHTGQHRFFRLQLCCRTGKQTFVLFNHTGYNDFFDYLGVLRHSNRHFWLSCQFLVLHSYVTDYEDGLVRNIKFKVTIEVGDGTTGWTFHQYARTNDRLAFLVNDCTAYVNICHRGKTKHQYSEKSKYFLHLLYDWVYTTLLCLFNAILRINTKNRAKVRQKNNIRKYFLLFLRFHVIFSRNLSFCDQIMHKKG